MAVSDFDARVSATKEFLQFGLGASLTHSAAILMAAASDEELDARERQSVAVYAAKTVMERVAWLAFGNWIGYFENADVASDEERAFFKEYREFIPTEILPEGLREIRNYLAEQEALTDLVFLRHFTAGFSFKRSMIEWYPCFQAAMTVSEMLSDGPITSFFNFLQIGDADIFKEHEPDPDQVMSALMMTGAPAFAFTNQEHPESVLAGFIRFTEYLSAMEALFPVIVLDASQFVPRAIPSRIADRDIMLILLAQMRWRYPADENALSRFSAVLFAFVNFANRQFHQHRTLAVQWDSGETMRQIFDLSQRFFFPFASQDDEARGQEDPRDVEVREYRQDAIQRRLREIRAGDEEEETSAS
jgi:hypothetical protein